MNKELQRIVITTIMGNPRAMGGPPNDLGEVIEGFPKKHEKNRSGKKSGCEREQHGNA